MFFRLEVSEIHQESGQPMGIFHAVRYLRDDDVLSPAELIVADQVFDWMWAHLDAPDQAILAAHPTAVSWFRATATEGLRQAELIAAILQAHGQVVVRRQAEDPGPLVYQDALQVLALCRPIDVRGLTS
jgi:hypothetical protein